MEPSSCLQAAVDASAGRAAMLKSSTMSPLLLYGAQLKSYRGKPRSMICRGFVQGALAGPTRGPGAWLWAHNPGRAHEVGRGALPSKKSTAEFGEPLSAPIVAGPAKTTSRFCAALLRLGSQLSASGFGRRDLNAWSVSAARSWAPTLSIKSPHILPCRPARLDNDRRQ